MNAQERLRVERLVSRLAAQPETPKDEDALRELSALMRVRPDAPYLLMQRALMLELMLEQAQLELEQLRRARQAMPPAAHVPQAPAPGLAERLLRRMAPSAAARATPGMTYGMTGGPAPGMGYGRPSASGGFLRNAAAVGAGVLGGSLLFQGLENLFDGDDDHHHHYGDPQGLGDMNDAGFAGGDDLGAGFLDDGGEGGYFDDGGSDWG